MGAAFRRGTTAVGNDISILVHIIVPKISPPLLLSQRDRRHLRLLLQPAIGSEFIHFNGSSSFFC